MADEAGDVEISDHTLIYYNARMAMREDNPLEATKLWLLRNSLESHTRRVSPHDPDFRSITWAALGELGVCADGLDNDVDGAGLWPLGMHNWVVRNRNRRNMGRGKPNPFDAFEVGRQARLVSVTDVLSAREIESVRLYRWSCVRPYLMLIAAGELPTERLSDRQVAARVLRHLLVKSQQTMAAKPIRGSSVIQARLFDIDLQLTALAAREARQKAARQASRGRRIGLSREGVKALREDADKTTLNPNTQAARIVRTSVKWPVDEWMALSDERRLFLFDHARTQNDDPAALDAIAAGIVDRLIAKGQGSEAEKWIARAGDPATIWDGERGRALMTLDDEGGFDERSVIALHRGVAHLQRGDLPGALRLFAYALRDAPDSKASDAVRGLSLRWLSYVASQFELTDELLQTLKALVPRREYALLLEDLMWGAAFRADASSYDRGVRNQAGRGALTWRLRMLEPLARGDLGGFEAAVQTGLEDSPSQTLRFLRQFIERLELEDADVRRAHLETLERLREHLLPLAEATSGRQSRTVDAQLRRIEGIVEGLGTGWNAILRDRTRALDPDSEVFAGSVRLAPSDALPWPFRKSEVPAPSIFDPILLRPVEWRDDEGNLVFGWTLSG